MNNYHDEQLVTDAWAGYSEDNVSGRSKLNAADVCFLLTQAQDGTLKESKIMPVLSERFSHYYVRDIYARQVSWSVYTEEYINSLKTLMQSIAQKEHPRVLETCAGRGVLAVPMEKRGIASWVCTDKEPVGRGHVTKSDALKAVELFGELSDVLFVSWVPYESELDYELAMEWVVRRGKPMVIVGEGWGGCTGSEKFWEMSSHSNGNLYDILDPSNIVEDFRDVPRWSGINDHTSVVMPRGK